MHWLAGGGAKTVAAQLDGMRFLGSRVITASSRYNRFLWARLVGRNALADGFLREPSEQVSSLPEPLICGDQACGVIAKSLRPISAYPL